MQTSNRSSVKVARHWRRYRSSPENPGLAGRAARCWGRADRMLLAFG